MVRYVVCNKCGVCYNGEISIKCEVRYVTKYERYETKFEAFSLFQSPIDIFQ